MKEMNPLKRKFSQLPRFVEFERDIKPELDKAGISTDTFDQDQKVNPKNIPNERLQAYAEIFNCKVSDLLELKPVSNSGHD